MSSGRAEITCDSPRSRLRAVAVDEMDDGEKDHDVPAGLTASPPADEVEDLVGELDRLAMPLLEGGRAKRIAERLERLDSDDLDGHAWASGGVAAASQGETDNTGPPSESPPPPAARHVGRRGP